MPTPNEWREEPDAAEYAQAAADARAEALDELTAEERATVQGWRR